MSLHLTVRVEEPQSRRTKPDSVIWIRATELPHGELSGRGYESNAVVGSTDAGVDCGGLLVRIVVSVGAVLLPSC